MGTLNLQSIVTKCSTGCELLNEDNDDDASIVLNGMVYIRKEEAGGYKH